MQTQRLSLPRPRFRQGRPWRRARAFTRRASVLALVLPLHACVSADANTAPDATAEQNRAVVRELFDAMNHADTAKLDSLYADDFEIWTAGVLPISGTRTRAQALEGMGMIDAMFPTGIRFEITGMTVDGERVAVEAESDGVHVSGKRYHNQYHFLVVIRDGKIHRLKEYMDTMHAKEVLMALPAGSTPAPAESLP